jgi:hypothetical protein
MIARALGLIEHAFHLGDKKCVGKNYLEIAVIAAS